MAAWRAPLDVELVVRHMLEQVPPDVPLPLHYESRDEGIELVGDDDTAERDRQWLRDLVVRFDPDMLILTPPYKATSRDLAEEGASGKLAGYLDRLRAEAGCALIIEAHTTHADQRRPYGSSRWKRWAPLGFYLADNGTLIRWRRPRRDDSAWPEAVVRGDDGDWPWVPAPEHVPQGEDAADRR